MIAGATKVGLAVRALQAAGKPVPEELQAHFGPGGGEALPQRPRRVRRPAADGGHRRRADRPRDPRVLLRLRRPGDRGLRHDGDLHGHDDVDARAAPARRRRPGAAGRRDPHRRRRRGAGRRAARLPGLPPQRRRVLRRRRSTAGCTRATWAGSTRTATSTSRAARRTSSSPRAARTSRRPTSRTTSRPRAGSPRRSCTATGGPYPVALLTLDPEEIVHFARERGLSEDVAALVARARRDRARPGRGRRGQRALLPGRADQALPHPRPRPLPGDGGSSRRR